MDTNEFKRSGEPRRKAPPAKRRKKQSNVVYTEAKPFNRRRFILQLVTVFAVVLALLLGLSIFFKSRKVLVSGNKVYTAYEVKQAAGIQDDDNLFMLNKAKIAGRITKKLPYVKTVRVEVKLPDTVLIEITEIKVTYAVQASNDEWWLIDKDGKVVDQVTDAVAKNYTKILGVKLADPKLSETAVAYELPVAENPEEETAQIVVYESERLAAALSVLPNLEANGLVGPDVVSVDVSDIGSIEVWYKQQYRVLLGDSTKMDVKISALSRVIEQNDDGDTGILDISDGSNPDKVIKIGVEP